MSFGLTRSVIPAEIFRFELTKMLQISPLKNVLGLLPAENGLVKKVKYEGIIRQQCDLTN